MSGFVFFMELFFKKRSVITVHKELFSSLGLRVYDVMSLSYTELFFTICRRA